MGNTCMNDHSNKQFHLSSDDHPEGDQDEGDLMQTPRLMLKPEKLPSMSQAIKVQSKRVLNERIDSVGLN